MINLTNEYKKNIINWDDVVNWEKKNILKKDKSLDNLFKNRLLVA